MPVTPTIDVIRSMLPERPGDGHKGTFGHVLVIAGSRGFTGAAKLAAYAAARSGTGLVTVGIPRTLADAFAADLLEPMSLALPATDADSLSDEASGPALAFARGVTAVALGPGLSQHPRTQLFAQTVTRECAKPMVIDADGLNALSHDPDLLKREDGIGRVITPHPGEMARLVHDTTGAVQHDRLGTAQRFAGEHGCVVVLKGHRTIVTDGETVYINPTGNAGMASGGTGDVLAGLIGGLLAQGMPALDAAVAGVYVHGLAGDCAEKALTQRGMIAGDVLGRIPEAWLLIEGR